MTDDLVYDLIIEDFLYKNQAIGLRHKEKRFCNLLLKNIDTYVSNETIYDYVWEGEIKTNYPLRQLVAELRRKLPFNIIHTKIKVGYIISTSQP